MSLFPQLLLPVMGKIAVDLFAGGGGASVGYEMATGRHVDVAINHDPAAVEMHKANHPDTLHLVTDVFEVDPRLVCDGRDVGMLWASPDCTHHSKARGGKPIRTGRKRRALAWVVTRWAGTVKPDVIFLENVEEFAQWGPLVGKPTELRPCPKRKGKTFRRWVKSLTDLGYVVEWREIRAYVYGAPTIRKRLYLMARRDGMPIVWPKPTHIDPSTVGENEEAQAAFFRANKHLSPWRTAAECIDWSIPMCSIFATKEEAKAWGKFYRQASPIRPLRFNTDRRIARAVKRYVLDNPKPYLVTLNHGGDWQRAWSLDDPMRTVTSARDAHSVMVPVLGGVGGRAGQSPERSIDAPTGTVTGKADVALFAPIVVTNRNAAKPFSSPGEPTHTITAEGAGLTMAAPVFVKNNHGDKPFSGPADPLSTIVAGGTHHMIAAPFFTVRYGERTGQEPRCRSIEEPMATVVNDGNGATLAAAGLGTYYGGPGGADRGVSPFEPLRTQGTENRFGLWASVLGQFNGGFAEGNSGDGHDMDRPISTISTKGPHQALISACVGQENGGFYKSGRSIESPLATIMTESRGHFPLYGVGLTKARGTSVDANPAEPLDTVSAGGTHHGLLASCLAPYYRTDQASALGAPLPTQTTVDRHALAAATIVRDFGKSVGGPVDVPIGALTGGGGGKAAMAAALMMRHHGPVEGRVSLVRFDDWGRVVPDASVTVNVAAGTKARDGLRLVDVEAGAYYIADILMRMLQPKELYLAQGFPPSYIIDRGADGRILTKTEQVRMVGNSVCPPVAAALIAANVPFMVARPEKEIAKVRREVALAA